VIAVDTNVLVYADRAEMTLHKAAVKALTRLAEGNDAWALPVFVIPEFVRVVSHPRLFEPPTPASEARDAVDRLLASPSARLLLPGDRFVGIFGDVVRTAGCQGNHVFDAQIVALCIEHGARTILSQDHDFKRFTGVELRTL
jgi:toxin-antitoxin system PIN domain toxin